MDSTSEEKRVAVAANILAANDEMAAMIRQRLAADGVRAIDLIGSPGCGKTALLEATIPRLLEDLRIGVVEGDIATSRDAQRIEALGVPVVQITTESFGGACHLEASSVLPALDRLPLRDLDLLFVENVGNLVCPAEFDIGQSARVVVLSMVEGEDKPLKYPLAFREASAAIISKMDLLDCQRPDMAALHENLARVNPHIPQIELSARTGSGLEAWIDWIRKQMGPRSSASGPSAAGARRRPS